MKKYVFAVFALIILLLSIAYMSPAANLYNAGGVLYTRGSYTLLSAVTTTGTSGTAVTFDSAAMSAQYVPISKHLITMTWSGVTPTNVVVDIKASQDGTNYLTLNTITMTSSPTITLIDFPTVYLLSTLVSRSNGSTNTAVTVTGTSGGQ